MEVGERRELYNGFGDTLARAFEFAGTPLLFGFIGHYLDGRLGTGPALTVLLVVFALAGVTVRMYYGYVAAMEAHEAKAAWKASPSKRLPVEPVMSAEADGAPAVREVTAVADQAAPGRRP